MSVAISTKMYSNDDGFVMESNDSTSSDEKFTKTPQKDTKETSDIKYIKSQHTDSTLEERSPCKICSKTFKHKFHLTAHVKSEHGDGSVEVKARFACENYLNVSFCDLYCCAE